MAENNNEGPQQPPRELNVVSQADFDKPGSGVKVGDEGAPELKTPPIGPAPAGVTSSEAGFFNVPITTNPDGSQKIKVEEQKKENQKKNE